MDQDDLDFGWTGGALSTLDQDDWDFWWTGGIYVILSTAGTWNTLVTEVEYWEYQYITT